jgi:hypothetical protein
MCIFLSICSHKRYLGYKLIRCEKLSLTASLNKFLRYLTTLVLNLVCSDEQICYLTIFIHGLTLDESHIYI